MHTIHVEPPPGTGTPMDRQRCNSMRSEGPLSRQESMQSIMEDVWNRIDQLHGTPSAAILSQLAPSPTTRSPRSTHSPQDHESEADQQSAAGCAWRPSQQTCSIPFRLAVLGPITIMLIVCAFAFVTMVTYTMATQGQMFESYNTSILAQQELIDGSVVNATKLIFKSSLSDVSQALFVEVVEPTDRAVNSLWGAMRFRHSAPELSTWNFSGLEGDGARETERREFARRAWEELDNQWRCTPLASRACSGRSDGIYAALTTEAFAGAAFYQEDPTKLDQLLLDAPAANGSHLPDLKVFEAVRGVRGSPLNFTQGFGPTSKAFFTAQSDLAAESAGGNITKVWSEVHRRLPWAPSPLNRLAISWTLPIAYCGNYSCFEGVIAADINLDVVSLALMRGHAQLRASLAGDPWNYDLLDNESSVFVLNKVSRRNPAQQGLLIGTSETDSGNEAASDFVDADNSSNPLVAMASKALHLRFGGWNATDLKDDQVFTFRADGEFTSGSFDCTAMDAALEDDSQCYQIATHSMSLDDDLRWLVVLVLPAKASSLFYAAMVKGTRERVELDYAKAKDRQTWLLCVFAVIGALTAVISLGLGLVTSCLVLRPLQRLRELMRRLTRLDFAHESEEYQKVLAKPRGRVRELNELQEGFSRLSQSIEGFARFVPVAVVNGLVRGDPRATRLHVARRRVTIMFSDIRDFTTLSESLSQNDILTILTLYLSIMTKLVESFQGVVGEIVGDGLLAFWNTPSRVERHAAKACLAALAQQQALGPLNDALGNLGLPHISIRIGLHTGVVLSGNIGSETKMRFGCIGDPVNLASRLEGLCKVYGVGIMCSSATHDALPADAGFVSRRLDLVQVKGRSEPTTIYELLGCRDPTGKDGGARGVTPARCAQAQLYEEALQAYQRASFADAVRLLEDLARQRPEDAPEDRAAGALLERAQAAVQTLTSKELENWTGVVTMTEK